jgi:hypothetical protein
MKAHLQLDNEQLVVATPHVGPRGDVHVWLAFTTLNVGLGLEESQRLERKLAEANRQAEALLAAGAKPGP